MYLTRFRINTARAGARRLLGSPNFMHGAVNMAFPDPPPRDGTEPRVLWRVDPAPAGRADLFIVSPGRPDLTHLVEEAGWPGLEQPGWTTFVYDEFLGRLTPGSTWGFRLTANPVHNIRRPVDSRDTPTKRAAHVTPRHQIGWLLQRQERAGFEVVHIPVERRLTEHGHAHEVIVDDRLPLQFRKSDTAATTRHQVRFTRVTFDGRLRVTDVDVFRRTLTHGLGKAKAYGCGLMTLAPLKAS
ncbi:type I-E CRISPR-associated protein Cas6/Cse3/CasE [Streptomyces triculaminicus]|uniref:type I-E CRISPR-associated protein Cas6/Cse3/CasE n=1 Tax=Streptomyces triculaminicus TaxID=2816232 RepID=UPI0033D87490